MENLNAEQVKKGLECCCMQELTHDENCPECPYTDLYPNCFEYLGKNALALINSQEQRIKELAEENERLTVSNKILVNNNADLEFELAHTYDSLEDAKADTVRKMQERLKERNEVYCINKSDLKVMNFVVDQIAKEMLEEKNETTHSN